jgi:hypothetical protein
MLRQGYFIGFTDANRDVALHQDVQRIAHSVRANDAIAFMVGNGLTTIAYARNLLWFNPDK